MRIRSVASASLLCLLTAACSKAGKPPATASSSGQTAYAMGYGDELAAATKAVTDAQAEEKELSAGFAARVDALKDPDWTKVEAVIVDSDEAGKSAGFADARDGAGEVEAFWDSEKNTIIARANGGAQHAVKEAGCTADTGGAITYALNDAIKKQLQKKLRAQNEAFVVLERYRTSLGPQNVATLEKLADDIAEASYDVHVFMIAQRNRLQRLVSDKDAVKKTLDRFIEDETAFQNEPGRTAAEKKASQDRIADANEAKSQLDAIAQQAEAVSKDMEKSIDAATKDYDEALKNLKAKVDAKRSSAVAANRAGK